MLFCISDKLLIQEDPALYFFINQGCLTVDNMDDKEEMQIVDVRLLLSSVFVFTVFVSYTCSKMSAYKRTICRLDVLHIECESTVSYL